MINKNTRILLKKKDLKLWIRIQLQSDKRNLENAYVEFEIWGGWQQLSVHRKGPSSVLWMEGQSTGFKLQSRKYSAVELQHVLPDWPLAC